MFVDKPYTIIHKFFHSSDITLNDVHYFKYVRVCLSTNFLMSTCKVKHENEPAVQ